MSLALQTAKQLKHDQKLYSEKLLYIKTKEGEVVKLEYNEPQQKIHNVAKELEAEGKPVKIIVLKARQQGISTWVQSHIFNRSATRKAQNAMVIAHDDDSSTNLFRMSQLFYDKLPERIEFADGSSLQIKPKKKYSNRKELAFADLHSQIRISTAGNLDAGRSSTIHLLHCSEVAFWDNPYETMGGLLQALPDSKNTFAIVESTANGVGGYFYDMWQSAKAGRNEWTPVFIAWFELKEYSREFETEEEKQALIETLDKEETQLLSTYGLTLEQLYWRRWTIANKCNDSVELFRQEYPSNDTEAFLTSGRPYFLKDALMAYSNIVKGGIKGNLVWKNKVERAGIIDINLSEVEFVPTPDGYLEIWEMPDKTKGCYAIGADVAEGLEDGDFSVGEVLNRDTGAQAAEWHGHIDPDLFGEELVKLGTFYNKAWIGPEANNHGISTNKAIVKLRYNRLYRRERALDEKHAEPTDKLGWLTTSITRPIILDNMATAIREGNLIIKSRKLLNECLTFVKNTKGKPEAQSGCHDDTVMATAIALHMHSACPVNRPVSRQERLRRERRRQRMLEPTISDITGY